MSKREVTEIPPGLRLDRTASAPLFSQLYERLRRAILSGQLVAGARLPSTRTLARQLHVSRNLVVMVYELLAVEGLLEGHVGHGTRIAPLARELLQMRTQASPHQARAQAPRSSSSSPASIRAVVESPDELDGLTATFGAVLTWVGSMRPADCMNLSAPRAFHLGVSALDAFPQKLWARLVSRRLRGDCETRQSLFTSPCPAGYQPLREAVAAYLGVTRGVRCTAEQVLIVAGGQGALNLAARVALRPGDAAWVEDPGCLSLRAAVASAGAHIVPVPVDGEGLDVDTGMARHPEARVAIVTPSHHCPLGVTMSLRRRLALLAWAKRVDGWVIEDDYDSDFRYAGRPLAALQGLDEAQRVVYVGTLSDVLSPALRVGYLVAPPQLTDVLIESCYYNVGQVPIFEQAALADFMEEGHFTRHIGLLRSLYAQRRAALLAALQQEIGERLTITVPDVGLSLVGWLPSGVSDSAIARQAAAHDVAALPVSAFSLEPRDRGGLVLGYAAVDETAITSGVRRLATALGW
jgi:GntR family transcriptional regulator / MocR family aminotransferase